MGLNLETKEYYDNGGGADYKTSPTKMLDDRASFSLNMDYTADGSIRSRYGSTQINVGNQVAGGARCLGVFDYVKTDSGGNEYEISAFGTDLYIGYNNPVPQGFALSAGQPIPDFAFFADANDEFLYYGNGVDTNLEFDGTTWRNWSIVAPAAPSLNAIVGGGNLVDAVYTYHVTFARYDDVNDVIIKESPLSPAVDITSNGGPNNILLNIPVSLDPQVNARVIYRKNNANGIIVKLNSNNVTVANKDDATFLDTVPEGSTSVIEADDDNANAPTTAIFQEYNNRIFMAPADSRSDLRHSENGRAWNVPVDNLQILDGKITAMQKFYGSLIIGTDRSIWVFNGDPGSVNGGTLKRVSSKVGILNNRCLVGESILYFMSTTRKVYALRPTDFDADEEIRLDIPLSDVVSTELDKLSLILSDRVSMEYYSNAESAKVCIFYNTGVGDNSKTLVYNEEQSLKKGYPVWQPWNNLNVEAVKQVQTNKQNRLVAGDANGFLWKLEDEQLNGDGAEINGTATAGTINTVIDDDRVLVDSIATAGGAATLTDAAQNFAVNEHALEQIFIYQGTGVGQTRTVQSNTATEFTVTAAWDVVPDATSRYYVGGLIVDAHIGQRINLISGAGVGQSNLVVSNTPAIITVSNNWQTLPDSTTEYTIGGYETVHFSNWKYVLQNYDVLKQLWYIWLNANANGNYNISMILQRDFDEGLQNQTELLLNLSAANSVWGQFIWGLGAWGSRAVFQDRLRPSYGATRFRALRVGFKNFKAGQPWQVNGFSVSAQNKGLFFASS